MANHVLDWRRVMTRTAFVILVSGVNLASVLAAGPREAQKPLAEPSSTEALVYLMREGGAGTESVFVEDKLVGVLPNHTYTFANIEPGVHTLWGKFHRPLFVYLSAGQTHFVLVDSRSAFLKLLPPEEGGKVLDNSRRYRVVNEKDREKGRKDARQEWPTLQPKVGDYLKAVDRKIRGLPGRDVLVPLTVYLPKGECCRGYAPEVDVDDFRGDDTYVSQLQRGAYLTMQLPPGQHTIDTGIGLIGIEGVGEARSISILLVAGEPAYVRINMVAPRSIQPVHIRHVQYGAVMEGYFTPTPSAELSMVKAEVAQPEIQKLKPMER
jgi:hypothetical protein